MLACPRDNAYMQNFLMLAPVMAKTGGFGSSAATAGSA
jgi:hypothetical protein